MISQKGLTLNRCSKTEETPEQPGNQLLLEVIRVFFFMKNKQTNKQKP